jgi:DNA topoisomerase-1
MSKNLVIVESPSKSKTIGKYLGNDYNVLSSKGHIRDLATTGSYGLGVDIENGFKPNYIPIKGKESTIKELKKAVKDANMVYLASDPDREGEAIAWHLKDTLGIKDNNYKRVLFNEITHDKVLEAIKNPTVIDDNLVKSQETRRILDRIIGFRLSKLLQNKIGAKSAGRVQSVALLLIVQREREIASFVPTEYWTITANFKDYSAELFKYKEADLTLNNKEEADAVLAKLAPTYIIESITSKDANRLSRPPFTTSTLQQDASNKLGFPAKKTMSIAQKLYEGIDIGSETVGLITYMRTDSVRLSSEFVGATLNYIETNYGKEYKGFIKKAKNTENVQDAHEAIRPTSILREPDKIKSHLSSDEYKLYNLIYKRALASLMANAKVKETTIILDNNDYKFKATGNILLFDGYLKVYSEDAKEEDKTLPKLNEKETALSNDVSSEQHFTKPKPRYTEAKLIKTLEELGIGRPSTYAKIIDTLKERLYVTLEDKKFKPTTIGIETTDKLQEFFSDLINVEYTKNMEEDLDKVAEGKLVWNKVLADFYTLFEPRVKNAFNDMDKKAPETTGEVCPECGSPLVKRKGRYGEFVACSNYPTCKYIKKEPKVVKEIMPCPECGEGMVIEKHTKRGKIFYGCNRYPKCKFASWDEPLQRTCPKCGKYLVKHNKEIKCSNCDYIES